jgi:hypothetical protein
VVSLTVVEGGDGPPIRQRPKREITFRVPPAGGLG